jgi:redox-sensitive bicupin YhaK (pirin superfamily)
MKTILHKAGSRGHADHGWLNTHHTFSFANYYDPARVHFGTLRVLNDDWIAGGGGFGRHPHDNMEIVTIVLEGELEHKDSMGHTMVIHTDEVQVMSAGTGIFHSEYNSKPDIPVQLLQIWVFPEKKNIKPRYDQKSFDPAGRVNKWQFLVSPDDQGALQVSQQARFSRITLDESTTAAYSLHANDHGAYVFVIDGQVDIEGYTLEKRDGLGISEVSSFTLNAGKKSEILVIEVPMN